jgi:hypothetical protein
LTFPTRQTVYEGSRQTLWFHAREDFQTVPCGITREALCRLAGKDVPDTDLKEVFEQNAQGIRAVAILKFVERRFEKDRSILVTAADI